MGETNVTINWPVVTLIKNLYLATGGTPVFRIGGDR
jgi:hypothetical protein